MPPYAWSLSPDSDGLPPGLALAANGRLSGTPAGAGANFFNVRATDAAGHTTNHSMTLAVTGNLPPNWFLAAKGVYRGLFAPADAPREQTNSGAFVFTLAGNGVFSGKLWLGSETNSIAGKFDANGSAQAVSPRHCLNSLTTRLQLDRAGQAVQGSVTDGSFTAVLTGDQNVFNSGHKATNYAGQYTLVIPGTNDPAVGPFGAGCGTVRVDDLGNITFAGSLADGTAVSQSSAISKDGNWPFYLPLYGGGGSVWGVNSFAKQGIVSAGWLSWINAAKTGESAVARAGFTNPQARLIGFSYSPTNKCLPGRADFYLTLEAVRPPLSITSQIGWSSNNTINVPQTRGNTNGLRLTGMEKTGVISGSCENPSKPGQRIQFTGVLLQNQTNAQGWFVAPDQSGSFLLAPQ